MVYAFGEFELDERLYQLRRGGAVVKLEPKVFDVLAHLIRFRARVVSKEELLDSLWRGEFVSESVLPRCIAAARKALADTRSASTFIATVYGRGYRFLAEVAERADAAGSAPGATAPQPNASDVFVGRQATMAELRRGLGEAMAGRGRLLLLVGEPGIGKTRTADEIAAEAARQGCRVVTGRCYEGEGAPAFWPWVQVLRACVQDRDALRLRGELGPGAADIAELVPELRQRLPDVPVSPPIASEQARFRLFDGITTFLQRSSAAQPLLVVLDDLHWADPSSLQVLQFLARELRHSHLLVIGAYRDVELRRDHPLAQVLGELAREPLCQRVLLRGLEEPDVRRFIEHAAGTAVSDTLAGAVYQMTEGNPFFIGEIVRWLIAQERLHASAGDTPVWNVILPQGVREAVGRRLSALSEECNQVLAAAAAVGREFNVAVLADLTGRDRKRLLELLDEADRARIVYQVSPGLGAYSFSHTLIRQTLYDELSAPRRVLLHLRIGEVLEDLYRDDRESHLAALAHHFFQAASGGHVDKAIDYATRAAQRAVRLLAHEEAAAHFARALQLLEIKPRSAEGGDPTAITVQRCELLLALGEAHSGAGNRDQSQHCCRQAASLARRLGRADLLARAALGFGQRAELGPLPAEELRVMLDDALRELPEDAYGLRARVTSRLAGTAPYQHSMQTRGALSRQAVELAKRSGDTEALFDALGARLWALMGPDHDEERLRVTAEVEVLVEHSGPTDRMLMVHEHRMRCFLSAGDMASADRANRLYEALAHELRQPVFLFFAEFYHVGRALGDGRFAEAEVHIERSLTLGERLQHPATDAIFVWHVYWLLRQQGRIEELEPTLTAMIDKFSRARHAARTEWPLTPEGLAERYSFAPAFQRAADAYWRAETGQEAQAQRSLQALSGDAFAAIPRDEWWTVTLTLLAEVCARLADAPRAAHLYDLLAPFATKNAAHHLVRTYSGAIAHFLGLLARTMDQPQTAARHFELALEMNDHMGALPALVRTQYEYARLLGRGGRTKDGRRARNLFAQALQSATDLGMSGLRRTIAAIQPA
jgi:DNA-binding winged helix-turn-helix (wHTH) protein/tetratricopeptide (TPR) repeat protein